MIEGNLSIVRSFPLVSLGFFKKLRVVKGETGGKDRYGLKVLENPNLEALFPRNVTIEHGRMFFHFNPKLCMKTIYEFKERVIDLRGVEKLPVDEVAPYSNGDKIACDIHPLVVNITRTTYNLAILELKQLAYDDEGQLIGYILYYMPAPFKNVSMFDSRDGCGNDPWTREDITFTDDNRYSKTLVHILTQLKPDTQYAYFVRTYTAASEQRGGLSPIQYFKTLPRAHQRVTATAHPNDDDRREISGADAEEFMEFEDELHYAVYVK